MFTTFSTSLFHTNPLFHPFLYCPATHPLTFITPTHYFNS